KATIATPLASTIVPRAVRGGRRYPRVQLQETNLPERLMYAIATRRATSLTFLTSVALGSLLAGCEALPRGEAVPFGLQNRAVVPGYSPVIRSWGIALSPEFQQDMVASLQRERAWLDANGHAGEWPPANFLALSGGGADGAFGAGLLCGWSDAGTRPQF